MHSLLSKLILPLPLFCILLFLTFFQFRRKKQISAKRFFIVLIVWFGIISTPFIPDLLIKNLENKYSVFSIEDVNISKREVHILVLGAGYTNDKRLPATAKLSEVELSRLVEGIRLHRQIPASTLITSATNGKDGISQAEMVAKAAGLLGVEDAVIKKQTEPNNTWMEATEYKRLFGDTSQLILVSSAAHMPRAMYLFQKAGLEPMAAPTQFLCKEGNEIDPWFCLPSSNNIKKMESAVHEYAGLLWYKLGGN